MGKRVYLCFHHHSDLVWRRTKEGYDKVREEQILHNLKLFEEIPEYKFCFAQSNILEVFLSQNPEYEEKIKNLVENRKIDFVGGIVSLPDTNMVLGESIVRNILLGKKFYKEKFNKEVEVAWLMDVFGMNGQIPQILKKSSFKYLYPGRMPGLPEGYGKGFIWEGIDGSKIITAVNTHSIQSHTHLCNLPVVYAPEELLKITLENVLKENEDVFALYATEEGFIEEKFFEILKEIDEKKEVFICQPIDYYRTLENKELPVFKGEFNPEFSGCYTTRIELKKLNRKSEISLLTAEKISSISEILNKNFYPSEELNYLWKKLFICQFHDGICGCHCDFVYKDILNEFNEIIEKSSNISCFSLSKIYPEGKKEGIVIFNPNPWKRKELIEIKGNFEVKEKNRNLPTQNDGLNTYFICEIPAFGYKTLYLKKKKNENNVEVINKGIKEGTYQIENDTYRINVEEDKIFIKPKFLSLVPFNNENFAEILFREDNGDYWKENFEGLIMGREFEKEKVSEIFKGDIFTRITIEGEVKKGEVGFLHKNFWDGFEHLSWKKDFIFVNGFKEFFLKLKIYWQGKNTKIMIRFPTNINPVSAKALYEIPFGYIERDPYFEVEYKYEKTMKKFPQYVYQTSKGDWPALTWIDYSDQEKGLAISNKGTPGCQMQNGDIIISLLRSPTRKASGFLPEEGGYERGTHLFEFMILPHGKQDIEEIIKLSHNFNNPVITMVSGIEKDMEGSFISIDNPGILISCFKKAEKEDGYILRLYEATGKKRKANVKINFEIKEAFEVNLIEEEKEKINLEELEFKPFEIKTILFKK